MQLHKDKLVEMLFKFKIWRDQRGQDLVEYALMTGFVAITAAGIIPGLATNISIIFSKISDSMTKAASQGS